MVTCLAKLVNEIHDIIHLGISSLEPQDGNAESSRFLKGFSFRHQTWKTSSLADHKALVLQLRQGPTGGHVADTQFSRQAVPPRQDVLPAPSRIFSLRCAATCAVIVDTGNFAMGSSSQAAGGKLFGRLMATE